MILLCIASLAGFSESAWAQSPDTRLAWQRREAGRWGGAAWSDWPLVYGPYYPAPWHAYGPFYPAPWYWYGPCYPFVSCTAYLHQRMLEERWQRLEALRSQSEEARYAAPGTGPASSFPLPEATLAPESELQPEYRDTGKIRPGFEHSGELLPDFAQRRRAQDGSP